MLALKARSSMSNKIIKSKLVDVRWIPYIAAYCNIAFDHQTDTAYHLVVLLYLHNRKCKRSEAYDVPT